MRALIILWVLVGWSQVSLAQGKSDSLQKFARARADHYTAQQDRIRKYAQAFNKPLVFKDEQGNATRLVDITPSGFPIYMSTLNAGAATTTGAAQLESGSLGFTLQGANMLVGVWDGGLVKDHIELGSRVVDKEGVVFDTHATHVTGILIATGIDPAARGMAPLAKASTHDFDNDEAEMAAYAKPDQQTLLISSHSYGTVTGWTKNGGVWSWTGDANIDPIEDYRFGFYGARAESADRLAALAPYYTIVWAAGNDRADTGNGTVPADCNAGSGYDCIIPEGVAKNIITVGAVNKVLNYTNPFDVLMSFFSSWGPTDDGRIKPDLVGAGVNLYSLSAVGANGYTTLSGTSMSTPNVAGSLLLLQELYAKLHGGQFMKAATLKALAIHTTKEAGNFPGPDYSFGWGLLDDVAAAKLLIAEDGAGTQVMEKTLLNGQSWTLPLTPQANQKITATIVWTDPAFVPTAPALDATTLNLVNDLDVRLIDDQGREQMPWTLDPSNPTAQAVQGDNFRDNVEKIEMANPLSTGYTLIVRHKGSLFGGRQDFSIVLSYQPITHPRTFYWTGDAGDWSDVNHWSFTSGGLSAGQLPLGSDKVIVDENSFDGVGTDAIALSQDAACGDLSWMDSGTSGFQMNGHAFTVSHSLRIADPNFTNFSPALFRLNGTGEGSVMMASANLATTTLSFEGGSWSVNGKLTLDAFIVNGGVVSLGESVLNVNRLDGLTSTSRILNLDRSQINLNNSSSIDGTNFQIHTGKSTLVTASPQVVLQWQGVHYTGSVEVPPGFQLTINGDNHLGHLVNAGFLQVNGSNQIDTLRLMAGSTTSLANGTTQTLSAQTTMTSDGLHPITLAATTNASLLFSDQVKLCFDSLVVTHVDVKGVATVSAGTHSTITASSNWLQLACDQILFADFSWTGNCAGGMTTLTNQSSGNFSGSDWLLHPGAAMVHEINPSTSWPVAGYYPVTLTVTDGTNSQSTTRQINIIANTLPANQVVFNGVSLMSFHLASQYQWYKDGQVIPGATARSFAPEGTNAMYFVVTLDHTCNRVSDSLVVTGLAPEEQINMYPNPASEWIQVEWAGATGGEVVLMDVMGQEYKRQLMNDPIIRIPVRDLSRGLYILEATLQGRTVRKKVILNTGGQ